MQTLERNSIVACGSSWRLILALASPLALMVPALAVTDAFAGHAIAPKSQVDWRTHLTTGDDAVGESDVPGADTRDGRAARRLRFVGERWEARRLEVEHQKELGRGGNVRWRVERRTEPTAGRRRGPRLRVRGPSTSPRWTRRSRSGTRRPPCAPGATPTRPPSRRQGGAGSWRSRRAP